MREGNTASYTFEAVRVPHRCNFCSESAKWQLPYPAYNGLQPVTLYVSTCSGHQNEALARARRDTGEDIGNGF